MSGESSVDVRERMRRAMQELDSLENHLRCAVCLSVPPSSQEVIDLSSPGSRERGRGGEREHSRVKILLCGHRFCSDCLDSVKDGHERSLKDDHVRQSSSKRFFDGLCPSCQKGFNARDCWDDFSFTGVHEAFTSLRSSLEDLEDALAQTSVAKGGSRQVGRRRSGIGFGREVGDSLERRRKIQASRAGAGGEETPASDTRVKRLASATAGGAVEKRPRVATVDLDPDGDDSDSSTVLTGDDESSEEGQASSADVEMVEVVNTRRQQLQQQKLKLLQRQQRWAKLDPSDPTQKFLDSSASLSEFGTSSIDDSLRTPEKEHLSVRASSSLAGTLGSPSASTTAKAISPPGQLPTCNGKAASRQTRSRSSSSALPTEGEFFAPRDRAPTTASKASTNQQEARSPKRKKSLLKRSNTPSFFVVFSQVEDLDYRARLTKVILDRKGTVHDKVKRNTTHIVTTGTGEQDGYSAARSLKILAGLANNCWIVRAEQYEHFLQEEDFIISYLRVEHRQGTLDDAGSQASVLIRDNQPHGIEGGPQRTLNRRQILASAPTPLPPRKRLSGDDLCADLQILTRYSYRKLFEDIVFVFPTQFECSEDCPDLHRKGDLSYLLKLAGAEVMQAKNAPPNERVTSDDKLVIWLCCREQELSRSRASQSMSPSSQGYLCSPSPRPLAAASSNNTLSLRWVSDSLAAFSLWDPEKGGFIATNAFGDV